MGLCGSSSKALGYVLDGLGSISGVRGVKTAPGVHSAYYKIRTGGKGGLA